MKKVLFVALATTLASVISQSCSSGKSADNAQSADKHYDVVTYVWDGDSALPDPEHITGINYAFAVINDTRDGLIINNEKRFKDVIALKEQKPSLKVILSLGGSGASGFSEMAADSVKRHALAGDCARVIREYGIDGIDFDWEFPCGEGGRPDDDDNFTLVLKAVRDSIGDDKLLTIAGGGDLPGVNVPDVIDLLDYINVMAYDLGGQAPWHHTALYRSKNTGWRSVDEVVQDYLSRGVTPDKMLLGLGFYGRGDDVNFPGWTAYKDIVVTDRQTVEWDSVACVPYVADINGNLIIGYESPRSLKIKCQYIKDKGMRGAMCWRTELDADFRPLASTVADCLINNN